MKSLCWLLLATSGVAQAQDPAYDGVSDAAEAEAPETDLSAELGFTFASGNAYFITVNGGVNFAHRWRRSQFTANAGTNLNLARTDVDGDGTTADEFVLDENGNPTDKRLPAVWTSQRVDGLLRYDLFFGKNLKNSFYIAAGAEHDRLAGLWWRLNQQLGYARNLVDTKRINKDGEEANGTKLDLEVGLAYTEENFVDGVDDAGNAINTDVLDAHYLAARVFLGFSHEFNDVVSISDRIEFIENLFTPVDFRLYNSAALTTKLSDQVQYQAEPRPGLRQLAGRRLREARSNHEHHPRRHTALGVRTAATLLRRLCTAKHASRASRTSFGGPESPRINTPPIGGLLPHPTQTVRFPCLQGSKRTSPQKFSLPGAS